MHVFRKPFSIANSFPNVIKTVSCKCFLQPKKPFISVKNFYVPSSSSYIIGRHVFKVPKFLLMDFKYVNTHTYSSSLIESVPGSKYHPISAEDAVDQRMKEIFFEKTNLCVEEWDDIKDDLMTSFLSLTEENFDSVLMNCLLNLNNLELSQSFMSYLREIGQKPNTVTYMKYLVLCSRHIEKCGQDMVLNIFDKIRFFVDSSPVLDKTTIHCIVQGLCATDEWKKSFDYLKKLPLGSPTSETKNAIVCAALKNNEENVAWEILTTGYQVSETPSSAALKEYISFISKCSQNVSNADKYLLKFFKYLHHNSITIDQNVAGSIADYFKKQNSGWSVKFSKVNRFGECSGCGKYLQRCKLSETEFNLLRDSFLKRAVTKSDVFINTTARELHRYTSFIEKYKPFDFVLDGLNVAYSAAQENRYKQTLAKQLLHVVQSLSLKSRRILILGRYQMKSWPYRIMNAISRKALLFFVDDISQDDPFLIYAALASGPQSLFVSSDLMRDHMSRLEDRHLIQLFKKWQQSHQIYLSVKDNNMPVLTDPLKHAIVIQGDMREGWHIPYDDKFILDPYEELNNWICVQKSQQFVNDKSSNEKIAVQDFF